MAAGDVVAMFGVDCSSMDTFTDGRCELHCVVHLISFDMVKECAQGMLFCLLHCRLRALDDVYAWHMMAAGRSLA